MAAKTWIILCLMVLAVSDTCAGLFGLPSLGPCPLQTASVMTTLLRMVKSRSFPKDSPSEIMTWAQDVMLANDDMWNKIEKLSKCRREPSIASTVINMGSELFVKFGAGKGLI